MQPTPVHVAVLLVTNAHTAADESTVKSIIDRLVGAGHIVVECEVLRDSPQLVRGVFLKWIADLNIDVVLAIAGVDTECTGTALAPLITKPLDGFSELVRMISFEEIGTGAMLVDVTAAQCSSTFVFVMPASGGAVRSALDKILLPQLDSRTAPRNLVSRMPRLRTASIPPEAVPRPPVVAEPSSAVPVVITSEKTAIGVGAAQLRAPSAPIQIPHAPRPRPVTPGVVAIPPLLATPKPITDDERTTPVEAAPARPPRKTPVPSVSAIDASVMDESWSAPMPEEPAPVRKVVVVADTPQLAEPWIKPKHVVPPVEPPPPVEAEVKTPAAEIPSVPKTPPVGVPASAEPIAKIALKPAAPKTPAVGTPLPSIKAALVTSESQATASGEATATPVEPPAPTPRKRPPTDPPPLPLTARKRAPTDPPPPPKKIIVDDETLPIEDVTELATPISEIRPRKPIVEPILPSQRIGGTRSITEGAIFDGRELEADRRRRKRSKMPILIAFLAIVASAIVILLVVNFVGRRDGATSAAATPRPDPAPVVVPPPPPPPVIEIDAAETVIAQVDIDAAVEEPPPPIDAAEPEPPKPPPKADTRKPPVVRTPPVTPPAVLKPPDPDPPRSPPVANGCDEVSCILEKYGRSCCARFKPAGTVKITPSGLPESLDKTMIRAGVDRVRPVIIRCGETTPSKGTVKVAVSVKPDGHVDGANVADSPDATLGACVAGAIRKTSFNRTQNGGTFTYPFVF